MGKNEKGKFVLEIKSDIFANDLIFLIESLGLLCETEKKEDKNIIYISFTDNYVGYFISDQLDQVLITERFVKGVKKENYQQEMTCIQIDNETHLYLTEQKDLLFDCTDLVNNRRTKYLEKKQFVSVRKERDKESRFRFFQYKTGTIILYVGNLNFHTFFYLQVADKYKDYILSHKKIYDKYWLEKVIKDGKKLARVYFAKAEMLDTELVLTEKEKKEYFQKVLVQ